MFDTLDTILNVAPPVIEADLVVPEKVAVVVADVVPAVPMLVDPVVNDVEQHNAALQADADFARDHIKSLMVLGQSALQGALALAESGDNPRAFEVVGNVLTAVVAASRELVLIHKVKKDATKEKPGGDVPTSGNITIDKAVFVGRASDLLRELKSLRASVGDTEVVAE